MPNKKPHRCQSRVEAPPNSLTSKIKEFSWPTTKAVYVTSGQAMSGQAFGSSSMMECCNHEEADTRIVVHLQHALKRGAKTDLVRTVDTDPSWSLLACDAAATEAFVYLAKHPFQELHVDSEHFQTLERLTVIMYNKSSSLNSTKQGRNSSVKIVGRWIDYLPRSMHFSSMQNGLCKMCV